ncbi:hypothetical protein niasHT_015270 [Heterodera trifolii]|uniref:Glycoside hydrolase family 31 TIM barrel domain-containing protein n=1 Tax=Heterodera trifolii TaxID=157864 RepID=A0ABD2L2I1_9BILA
MLSYLIKSVPGSGPDPNWIGEEEKAEQDIDYMERFKDFTYDKKKWAGLPEFAKQLHSWDMKLVMIWDPPVQANYSAFQRAIDKGVSFIEWPTESLVQKEKKTLNEKTLCMIGKSGRRNWSMYDTSSGHYGGHWLGDNQSRWPDLRLSIIGVMEFNMFGIPQVGADVCGFIGDSNEELCLRWQQLGAFHSYYRNHNDVNSKVSQDPAQWKSVATATRVANLFRYRHLPYLYR